MKKFNFLDELKKIIASKHLVEINLMLSGKFGHGIAYLVDANDEFLTFANVSNDVGLQGVTICRIGDVESIQVETNYIRELEKGITDDSLYLKAVKNVENVKDFTFSGFISAFVDTKTVISVTSDEDDFTGRVVAHDDNVLVLDEYYAEDESRYSRTYINLANITTITVGGTRLEIISRSLSDKNL